MKFYPHSLVQDQALGYRVFDMLSDEFERTRRMILVVTAQSSLLERATYWPTPFGSAIRTSTPSA